MSILKDKRTLYVTVPIVIGIWGTIIYKIYNALKGEEIPEATVTNFVPDMKISNGVDTFVIFNNYRDPFLSGVVRKSNTGSLNGNLKPINQTGNQVSRKTDKPVINTWPQVQYSGLIRNQSNAVSLVLLSINGKTYTLKKGESAEGIKVLSFTNSEVELQLGKEKRVFQK